MVSRRDGTESLAPLLADEKAARLVEILRGLERVVVAYSGGVDSTFLLKVAHGTLGDRAIGVLGVSESLDVNEMRAAEELALAQGLPIERFRTREYDNPEYRRNDARRCYHCKSELFTRLREFAAREGYPWVLDGSHAGDRGDYRPGLRAREEQGVRSPLMEADLDKDDIRRFSRALGLPTWNKPAAPCLASRIPYGCEVTDEKLRQVEQLEAVLSGLGFEIRRVRHHGDLARIEVPKERVPELLDGGVLDSVVAAGKALGFLQVTVDPEGFRSGSLNAALGELVRLEPTARRAGS